MDFKSTSKNYVLYGTMKSYKNFNFISCGELHQKKSLKIASGTL